MKRMFYFKILAVLQMLFMSSMSFAQGAIPFTVNNNSPFADSDLYVAIVGIDYTTGNHVWVNPKTSQVLPMSSSYNIVQGPTPGGNLGPGGNGKYANCFARLSEIPNKTFTLPLIAGCRVFISKGSQMYLYFFGSSGAPSGYAGHNPLNPTDPNNGILYEMIELTNNQYGFFGNPTRVDSFKYPMGLELIGANGYQKKVGEYKTQSEIVTAFKANVPTEFQGCVNDATGEITAPSKTPAFAEGSGAYANYMKSYVDAIWNKYKTEDLIFYAGDAGVFKGRVIGEQLEVVGQSGGFVGRTGRVQYRPSTQEVLEGKGVLDRRLVDGDLDLVVQAQLCAAINRHMVNVTTANPGQQNWYNAASFYNANPTNHYSKFWHLPGISLDNLSYGFAYDDVADQSPSLHTPQPTKVIATFGGYVGILNPSVPSSTGLVTTYNDCNYGGFSGGLDVGDYNLTALQAKGVGNDVVSSIKVAQGYKVILYSDDNFLGSSVTLTSDSSCFDATWNDKVSSIKVRPNGVTTLAGKYTLQNRHSGLNMDVVGGPNGSSADGVNIQQWNVSNTTNQQFNFEHLGDGVYKITAVHSGKCIDVNGISKDNGANVQQWTYYGTPNQQFIVYAMDAGYYKLIAKHSGKVVEVAGYSTAAEGNVQQWENVNQATGHWKLNPLAVTSTVIQAESYSSMSGIQVEATTDTGGGSNVGYCDTGDWMAYTNINFPTTGSYLIEYRVASAVTGAKISSDLNAGSIVLGTLNVPNTGGWQNWQTISHTVNVNAGTYNFGIFIQTSGVNINWIKITKVANTAKVALDSKEITQEEIEFKVYPNPTSDYLFFSKNIDSEKISVVDLSGNVVSKTKISQNGLDVSNLSAGVYFVVIEEGSNKIIKRFLKK